MPNTPTARDLLDEARSFGHDGRCDHPGCPADAVWLIPEACTPDLWPRSDASLALYCASHTDGVPFAALPDVQYMAREANGSELWAVVVDAYPEAVRVA